MAEFCTTEVLVRVRVRTQFGPDDAVDMVRLRLSCPAIESVHIVGLSSNYRLHQEPGDMVEIPRSMINQANHYLRDMQ